MKNEPEDDEDNGRNKDDITPRTETDLNKEKEEVRDLRAETGTRETENNKLPDSACESKTGAHELEAARRHQEDNEDKVIAGTDVVIK